MTIPRFLIVGAALVGGAILLAGSTVAQRADPPYGGFSRGPNPYAGTKPKVITQAGQFDYYLLSLSWSPSYCASLNRDGYDPQCHRRDGKRYAFVLHGLWPQYNRGWPQDCPTADRGFVPRPVAQRMLDIMPSEKLVFHEYRKHGVCSGLSVDGYFDLSRKLYDKVKIPRNSAGQRSPPVCRRRHREGLPRRQPGHEARLHCRRVRRSGNRLKEVRVCFDKAGEFRSCGRNEDQKRPARRRASMCHPSGDARRRPVVPRSSMPGVGPKIEQSIALILSY